MGDVHQGFAGILLKPWGERSRSQKEVLKELEPRISSIRHGAGARLLAAGPAGLGRRTAGAVRHHHHARRTRACRCARRRGEVGARERASSSSPTRICASRRRRSSFISITTRRTGSASPWPISAARSATLLGGNYVNLFDLYGRSYQRDPAGAARLSPERELAHALSDPHGVGHAGAAVERRRRSRRRCSRTRSPISSSSIRQRCRRCRSRAARSARPSNS